MPFRFYAVLAGLLVTPFVWAEPSPTTVPLTLEDAVRQAVGASPLLQGAMASLNAAQGTEMQAGALPNPELGIEAENLAGSGDYRGTRAAEYTYSLSQKVELGGKRAARRSVASAERAAVGEAFQAARLDLVRDVTVAYGNVLVAQEKLRLVETREVLAKEVLTNVSQRVSAARDPLIYKSQADGALATTVLARQSAQRNLLLAKVKLANLWGGGVIAQPLEMAVLISVSVPEPLESYQARLASNPNLTRLTHVREARDATWRFEKAQNIPDPAVSFGVRDFKESGEQALVVGVSVPIPVFNRNRGNISRANAEIVVAEQDKRSAELAAGEELQETWQEWEAAYMESKELRGRIIPAAETALRLSREGYARGRFSFLEILNAQRTLADAQEQHLEALQRQLNAKAAVERLTTTTYALTDTPDVRGLTR